MNTILAPIDDIVAWVITSLYNLLNPVFGVTSGATWVLTIVLLTVLMRLVLVPLFIKQMHTQRAMTALTPKITELRKKYKGDREKLNAETMKLYQEAGVNPLMGCLPIVLQMPIFFALFSVLRYIAEWKGGPALYHLRPPVIESAQTAQIFGVTIKDTFLHATSIHVHVVVALVVATSMLTTYLTMRQNVKRGIMPTGKDNPMGQSQRMMTYILPLFALTGLYWPFGLVLYWVTTNIWTLGQQFVLLRKYPVGAAVVGDLPGRGTPGRPATASGLTTNAPAKPRTGGQAGPGSAAAKARPKPPAKTTDAASAKPGMTDKVVEPGVTKRSGTDEPGSNGRVTPDAAVDARPKPAAGPAGKRATSAGGTAATPGGARGDRPRPAGPTASGAANGHKPGAGEGGMLRRFSRGGRSEPEAPVTADPEVKLVRQQRQRQSRSKRSGKR